METTLGCGGHRESKGTQLVVEEGKNQNQVLYFFFHILELGLMCVFDGILEGFELFYFMFRLHVVDIFMV